MHPDSVDRQAQINHHHMFLSAGFPLPLLSLNEVEEGEEGGGGGEGEGEGEGINNVSCGPPTRIGSNDQFPLWAPNVNVQQQQHYPVLDPAGYDTTTTREWNSNNFITTTTTPVQVQVRPNADYTAHNDWIMLNEQSPPAGCSSGFSNTLSLSLASHLQGTTSSIQEQCSQISSSAPILTRYSQNASSSTSSDHLSLTFHSSHKLPPFLSGSTFLHAMQDILAEIASFALRNLDQVGYCATASHTLDDADHQRIVLQNPNVRPEEKKKHLLSLLQLVDDRYNQCLDEIHTVISAFHAVSEMDPYLHAPFALPTISFLYKKLRERISSYILAMGDENSFETRFLEKQWDLQQQQLRKRAPDPQMWRPQRGLPETSVSVLRAWMFQNFLHPYPKDAEKQLLALKSGLTRSQVSNWFINARVRLWKPMIEEMYAEINRRKAQQGTINRRSQICFENISRFAMD